MPHPNPNKLVKQARASRLFETLQRPFIALDQAMERFISPALNPFAQSGALANVSFVIAAITGVLILFWYSPSPHEAWDSMENMGFLGQLVRSMHRYSSDATMLFVLFHAAKLLVTVRFGGPRWLAWVTGVFSLGTLWLVGWLGYWLVWDVRAQEIAVATAEFVRPLPIFTDPLVRTFLTDQTVSSGLFVTVFFFHMLIPLVIGVAIWMHISRMARARFLTSRPMTIWVVASMVIASIVYPATSAPKAAMAVKPEEFTMDWWYLFPLTLTERLGSASLWVLALLLGIILYSIPWSLSKKAPEKAVVDLKRCNGCSHCADDCPYSAITMVPRTDGRPYELQAYVNPDLCVGCTICSGSCNSAGIGLPSLPVQERRKIIDKWVDDVQKTGEEPLIAFLCANSAAGGFEVSDSGHVTELPGLRCVQVPCSGWVNAITVERALRRGAKGVLVVGCGCSDPPFREGVKFTDARLEGNREPALRLEKVDPDRVRFILRPPGDLLGLLADVEDFRQHSAAKKTTGVKSRQLGVAALVTALLLLITVLPSDAPSLLPQNEQPEFVFTMKYRPEAAQLCRPATPEEIARMMKHMRTETICERRRPNVRVQIKLDNQVVHEDSYPAHGLSSDGPSFAVVRIPTTPQLRSLEVRVGDDGSGDTWTHTFTEKLDFPERLVQVLDFSEGLWTPHFVEK